ncbi:13374_t:CDS:2 [Funneliformis geosporum]|nr:13374_t:CDS:2 [Funneliformis geosporum]
MESTLKLTTNKLSKEICDALDKRLNELNDTAKDTRDEIQNGQANMVAILTGGTGSAVVVPMLLAASGGAVAGNLVGHKMDQDEKKTKNQEQELAIRNQTIESLRKDKDKNKLSSQLALLLSQQDDDKKEKDDTAKVIKDLTERIKSNNKNITSVGSSSFDKDKGIMEYLTLQNILIFKDDRSSRFMVNDDKRKTEFLLRYQELCNKIDEDYERIIKETDASLKKILKECDELISYIDRERYNLMVFHGQNLSKEIN